MFCLLIFRVDCFCNEYFLFCARDVDRLTESEISELPISCIYVNEETTTPVSTTKIPDKIIDTNMNTHITPKINSTDPITSNKSLNDND